MNISPAMSKVESRKSGAEVRLAGDGGIGRSAPVPGRSHDRVRGGMDFSGALADHPSQRPGRAPSAFTLIEVAISLAVIGIALVAIIGVLPLGMNVQKENREGTVINQDATVFLEAISKGARGMNDLTNYVYAITNNWVLFDAKGNFQNKGVNGYSFSSSSTAPGYPYNALLPVWNGIWNGTNIVGLLSTPQFLDAAGYPINNLLNVAGYSNHIIAYVRSISGAAAEKPPQDNPIIRGGPNDSGDAFAYHILCVNALVPSYTPPLWLAQTYNQGDWVSDIANSQTRYWQANAATLASDVPGSSTKWVRNMYPQELAANLHELRLTFFWPVQPNGKVGMGRQSYRTLIAGQLHLDAYAGNGLYFYQSQSFTNAP